ncbi:metal-dependent hydrolase [Alcanivorax sp. 1008]|uniref:metal-dependent hydrolase n=1 Tax=Alcanivorax sp. 1008 TaxID=2816853 RepID=UPI001D633A62|nr:metal-dependent hydrolase [Alcanivorax sp. 1008]MCC1496150.1 metal-dependent hydrolase [Alcanivorax sp. 1008]
MDSVSQMALGAAVSVAVVGRRMPVWKAAVIGAAFGTLPDLDVVIDYGDPIRNMTFHRAESHALFWLTLFSPLAAWFCTKWSGMADSFRIWWLNIWLILISHTLLDAMTVYGTQLLLPFSDTPLGVASIFIIDPLYTVPLLCGLFWAIRWRGRRGLNANRNGLIISTLYLCWTVLAQQHVTAMAEKSIAASDVEVRQKLVTPTPFNTLIWRVLVITPEGYGEGFYSLLDGDRPIQFEYFSRRIYWFEALQGSWETARIGWFSKGFFAMSEHDGEVRITDLRMGQQPDYVFSFAVARHDSTGVQPMAPVSRPSRVDIGEGFRWLGLRLFDANTPPLHRAMMPATEPFD